MKKNEKAFSLIEIMVTVTLLAVIIIGLVTMFNQTQRAMTSGLNQTDVLAEGRMAGEMLSREMEQTCTDPSYWSPIFLSFPVATNVWAMPGTTGLTNVLGEAHFRLAMPNGGAGPGRWIGFAVNADSNGIGTLMRSEGTNTNGVIDGVTVFKVTVFDKIGQPWTNLTDTNIKVSADTDAWLFITPRCPPAVSLEMSILERRTFEQYRALTNNMTAARQFLTNQAGHLHTFRQRINVRAGN